MAAKRIRGGQLRLLSEDNVKRIHHATLDVLNDVGIRLPHRQALELWADHGARVDFDHEVVHIPEHVLSKALALAPRRVTLQGKTPEWDVVFDAMGTVYTMGGAGAEERGWENEAMRFREPRGGAARLSHSGDSFARRTGRGTCLRSLQTA